MLELKFCHPHPKIGTSTGTPRTKLNRRMQKINDVQNSLGSLADSCARKRHVEDEHIAVIAGFKFAYMDVG